MENNLKGRDAVIMSGILAFFILVMTWVFTRTHDQFEDRLALLESIHTITEDSAEMHAPRPNWEREYIIEKASEKREETLQKMIDEYEGR